jgi:hypothetical protein
MKSIVTVVTVVEEFFLPQTVLRQSLAPNVAMPNRVVSWMPECSVPSMIKPTDYSVAFSCSSATSPNGAI